jgi:hypothetical protein
LKATGRYFDSGERHEMWKRRVSSGMKEDLPTVELMRGREVDGMDVCALYFVSRLGMGREADGWHTA